MSHQRVYKTEIATRQERTEMSGMMGSTLRWLGWLRSTAVASLVMVASLLCLLPALHSCRLRADDAEVAANAAKVYYEYLLSGKYGDFVDGTYRPDSIPDGYRSQLVDDAKMYVAQMRTEHGGLKAFSIGSATYDETTHTADVCLVTAFNNGDIEQVLVPMVLVNGIWLMR